jgi:hypothetical protein
VDCNTRDLQRRDAHSFTNAGVRTSSDWMTATTVFLTAVAGFRVTVLELVLATCCRTASNRFALHAEEPDEFSMLLIGVLPLACDATAAYFGVVLDNTVPVAVVTVPLSLDFELARERRE